MFVYDLNYIPRRLGYQRSLSLVIFARRENRCSSMKGMMSLIKFRDNMTKQARKAKLASGTNLSFFDFKLS